MSLYEEEDFINREDVELTDEEPSGLLMVPGQLVFEDAYEVSNGGNDDYAEKYSVTFRLPKGNEFASKLFAVCDHVGEKAWKGEAEEKLEAVWGGVDAGAAKTNISIADGDLFNPQYNRGNWQVKASRREDEGAPTVLLADGTLVEWNPESKTSIREAQKIGPKKGDYCYFLIRAWAQKKRERINLSLEGIQLVERGSLRVQQVDRKEIASKFGKAKALPVGFKPKAIPAKASGEAEVVDDEEEEREERDVTPRKAAKASAKASAKKAPPKKSLYRSKR